MNDDVKANPADAKAVIMGLSSANGGLSYGSTSSSLSGTTVTFNSRSVDYYYVDKDVTLTGKGKTTGGEDGSGKSTTKDFSISLKKGWNALYTVYDGTVNMETDEQVYTETISIGNPSLRWVYYEYDTDSSGRMLTGRAVR